VVPILYVHRLHVHHPPAELSPVHRIAETRNSQSASQELSNRLVVPDLGLDVSLRPVRPIPIPFLGQAV
jgi:hypothetical protein